MSLNSECSRLHWNVRRDYARLVVLRSQSTSLWHLGQGPPPIISIQWPNILALLKTYSFQRLERFLTQEQHIWLDYLDNNSSVVSFPLSAELEVDLALDVHEDETPSEPCHCMVYDLNHAYYVEVGFFLRRFFSEKDGMFFHGILRRGFIRGCFYRKGFFLGFVLILRRVLLGVVFSERGDYTYCNHNQLCPEWPLKFSGLNFFRCPEQYLLEIKLQGNLFRIINACTMYMLFWWRQFRLLTNNSGCYPKEFLRTRLLLRLTRCVRQTYIYVMVAWRELEDIIRTDTICPPRSSLYSGGAIDDGTDGTCVLSNPLYTNTYLVIHKHSHHHCQHGLLHPKHGLFNHNHCSWCHQYHLSIKT